MNIAAMAEEQQAAQQQQLAHVAHAQQFLGQRQQGGAVQVGDSLRSQKFRGPPIPGRTSLNLLVAKTSFLWKSDVSSSR